MRWDFHGLTIRVDAPDAAARDRWRESFAPLPRAEAGEDLSFALNLVDAVPPRPAGAPQFRQGDLIEYYVDGQTVVAYFPRFGRLRLDLASGATDGVITPDVLTAYGVFEDLVAIGLSPHLRRRGLFLIHAFAAARDGRAVLLVGGIGTGKSTTGMALLDAGWRLLSNDSPVLDTHSHALSYPGLLAAYPETFAQFESTAHLARPAPALGDRRKRTTAAERIWPGVWIDRAPVAAICFPHIESRSGHAAEPLGPPEALRRLLPHAVEQWDRQMIPEHLRVLRRLAEAAPAYTLRLGPDVRAIPALLEDLVATQSSS